MFGRHNKRERQDHETAVGCILAPASMQRKRNVSGLRKSKSVGNGEALDLALDD